MKPSRFVRPEQPATALILQARDYAILAALKDYRLLYTRHLQVLAFPNAALRQAQRRLRLLWEHKLLNRYFRPVIFDGTKPFTIDMAYALGPAAAGLDVRGDILDEPTEPSLITFDHDIAVADCLTALTAACRGRSDVTLASTTPETVFWRQVRARNDSPFLVPDGAFTLRYTNGELLTFYIEIVRADVRGGNATIAKKMEQYVELNREGRFRTLYGHEHLRAVLFLTTSPERAEHFRQLASQLPHGRRLFWFGSYQTTEPNGREATSLTPETMLTPRWRQAGGESVSLLTQ